MGLGPIPKRSTHYVVTAAAASGCGEFARCQGLASIVLLPARLTRGTGEGCPWVELQVAYESLGEGFEQNFLRWGLHREDGCRCRFAAGFNTRIRPEQLCRSERYCR